jgi:hypothetical protein
VVLAGPACRHRIHHPGDHAHENPHVPLANLCDGLTLLPGAEDDHHTEKGYEQSAHLAAGGERAVQGAGKEQDPEGREGVEQGRVAGDRVLQPSEEAVLVHGNEDDAEGEHPQPFTGTEVRPGNGPAGEEKETNRGAQCPGKGESARVPKADRGLLAEHVGAGGKGDVGHHQSIGCPALHGARKSPCPFRLGKSGIGHPSGDLLSGGLQ